MALVTGGAKRVGRSIALRLASEGADVVVNYMESKAEAEELVREIRAMNNKSEDQAPQGRESQQPHTGPESLSGTKRNSFAGRRAIAVEGDVSQRADVQKLFLAVESEFERLDILVNNAGIFFPAKFEYLTEEQWDRIMNTNLKSQFLCAQTAAPMRTRGTRAHH